MKKPIQIVIGILVIMLVFAGFHYYNNYKKRDIYKKAFIADLQQIYRHFKLVEMPETQEVIDELDKVMDDNYYKKILMGNDSIKANYAYYINEFNQKLKFKTVYGYDYKDDNVWKAAQLSGVLSQFSKTALEKLQHAYAKGQELNNIKKEILKLANHYVAYDAKTATGQQIVSAYRNTHYLLKEEQSLLFLATDKCRLAIEELDPENEDSK